MSKIVSLIDIIDLLKQEIVTVNGDIKNIIVDGIASLDNMDANKLDWVNPTALNKQTRAEQTNSSAIITDASVSYTEIMQQKGIVQIVVKSPRNAIAMIGNHFFVNTYKAYIHPTSVISNKAQIDKTVYIGPNAIIGKCIIGKNSIIHNSVTIENDVIIGDNVIIYSGSVLGTVGLGCYRDEMGNLFSFPHLGRLIIEDNVVIGANCSIARGSLSDTFIGQGTKINALCFIAHNCKLEENVLITGSTMLNGSVSIGRNSTIYSQVIIREQTKIGDNVIIGMGSVVLGDIPSNEVWVGNPAKFLKKR